MGCQLGRITGLESPRTIRQEDDGVLRIGGEFAVDDPVDGVVLAQQMTGYPNVDEPVVPFIYDATAADGLLDGFYVVEDTTVDYEKLAAGLFSWSANLAAIPGFRSPLFEVLCKGADRSSSTAVTESPWVALPGSAQVLDLPFGYSSDSIDGWDGTSNLFRDSELYDYPVQYTTAAGDFYDSAVAVHNGLDGTPAGVGPVIAGREAPNSPTGLGLRNDHIEVTMVGTTTPVLRVATRTGATSSSITEYQFGNQGAGYVLAPTSVLVLRNSPECCVLRWCAPYDPSGAGFAGSANIDVTLRRGAWWPEVRFQQVGGAGAAQWGVLVVGSTAGTAITAGVNASTGGNGGSVVTPSSYSTTVSGSARAYTTLSSRTFDCALFDDVLGSTYPTAPSATGLYFAAMRHRQRVVVR